MSHGRAMTHCYSLLQEDLVTSLRARIEGLAVEAEQDGNAALQGPLSSKPQQKAKLLHRIAIPLQVG